MNKKIAFTSILIVTTCLSVIGGASADTSGNTSSRVGITFTDDGRREASVKFDANGGTTSQGTLSGNIGDTLDLSKVKTATRSNYNFEGWYTAKTGNTKMPKSIKLKEGGVTYYAHWKEIPSKVVYRVYNPNTGEHFYPTSTYERDANVKAGWRNEGILEYSPTSGTPIYRIYNPNAKGGDHYYTSSKYEAQTRVKEGWKWDYNGKPVFYSGGTKPVYVAYNPNAVTGAHNYTMNAYEQYSLLKIGWKYGSTAWYALK